MGFINLTPHPVVIRTRDGSQTFPVSGLVARLDMEMSTADAIAGVPVVVTRFGRVIGLPDPVPGRFYIVSSLVAQAVRRPDVLAPDTGPTAIREGGQIVAVTRLQRFD